MTASGPVLADKEARERIRHDLDTTLVVEAAAGTGKTTALVGRVLSLLVTGRAPLSRIVAVTFTEKAAGEMKLRLRAEIERVRNAADTTREARRLLDAALAELEAARINTIHGFCADLLRERAVEAGVDPLFEVIDDQGRDRLFSEAFEPWFAEKLRHPTEGVRRLLRRRPRGYWGLGPRKELFAAGLSLVDTRDFDGAWTRKPFDRKAAIDDAIERLSSLATISRSAAEPSSWLAQNLEKVRLWIEELDRRELVTRERDYDGLESELGALLSERHWRWVGGGRYFAKDLPKAAVITQRDEAAQIAHQVLDRCDADLAAALRDELWPLVGAYEEEKARAGKLDFSDMLLRTRDLLARDAGVRRDLQARFSHLLVDEFQDTDPLQADILLLLAADDPNESDPRRARPVPGKLFVVGDPKQSIYRFRRADVSLYESVKRRLLDQGAALLHLSTSFRGAPAIQAFVNEAFAPLIKPNPKGTQAAYVPLEPWRPNPEGRPAIVALPVPRPYSPKTTKISGYWVSQSVPDAVGAFVDWLLRKSGWTVGDGAPISSRHVCLLFKRFQQIGEDVTRPYVRALEARRVPHVLLGGRSFHEREEVMALRSALSAIEWPDDELSVYATLRGPFFAFGDDALLVWRSRFGPAHPMRPVDTAKLDDVTLPVHHALELLAELHRRRNRRPIADTIGRLLDATRAHAGIAIWPTGEQALANVLRMMDLARRFEAEPATSFRAFVQWLDEEAEDGQVADAPVVEEGTDGVRMMTVHRAKGLEFPVVILVDPTATAHPTRPSRWVDADRRVWAMPLGGCAPDDLLEHAEEVLEADHAESVRLLYVATTRARDLLVVPAVGDEPVEGWLEPLHPVIYPKPSMRRRSVPAPGCPRFLDDSVLERPADKVELDQASVKPGLHVTGQKRHEVVWWDPRALELDRQDEAGLRQQRILAADQGSLFANEGERMYAEWKAAREKARQDGAVPTLRVRSVTEAASEVTSPAPPEVLATDAPRDRRPRGKRFGSLVHAILATVPLDAHPDSIAVHARTQARMFSATEEEISAAVDAVTRALAHPLLVRARAAAEVRRESPISICDERGETVEGVLDLALLEEGAWTVVDFKTDAELGELQDRYAAQVALYAEAVSKATGLPARGVLLRV